ncbi:MAG: hypothetical protein LAT83_23290, partial [Kiritimatiellae bacterium]|nr:hypothetical protein [Kiritimatiellia bacterium]
MINKSLFVILLFLSGVLRAETETASLQYDVYLYHIKAQRDYWTGGAKDHGRAKPYVKVGTVTEEQILSGIEINMRGNNPNVVLDGGGSCEPLPPGGAYPPEGLIRHEDDDEIGIMIGNSINTNEMKVWNECKQKILGDLGDGSYAAMGVILLPRTSTSNNEQLIGRLKEKAALRTEPGLGSELWLERDNVLSDLTEVLSELGIALCGFYIGDVVSNQHDADVPNYLLDANGDPELDENDEPIQINRDTGRYSLLVRQYLPLADGGQCPATGSCPFGGNVDRVGEIIFRGSCAGFTQSLGPRGRIGLCAAGPNSELGSPLLLSVPGTGPTVVLENEFGEPFQIFTGNSFTEITVDSRVGGLAVKYQIKTQEVPDQTIEFGKEDYSYVTGEGVLNTSTTVVERLAADGSEIRITNVREGVTKEVEYKWKADMDEVAGRSGWLKTEEPGTGAQRATLRTRRLFDDNGVDILEEISWILDADTEAVQSRREARHMKFGDDWWPVEETVGFNDNTRVTTMAYYTDADGAALEGLIKTEQRPDGNWVHYEYDTLGRRTRTTRSFQNNPLADPVVPGDNRVTEYDYTPLGDDPGTIGGVPRTVTEKVQGQVVGITFTILELHQKRTIRAATPASAWDDPDNLVTTVFYDNNEPVVTLMPDGLIRTRETTYMGDMKTVTTATGKPDNSTVDKNTRVEEGSKTVTVTHRDHRYEVSRHSYRITPLGEVLLSGYTHSNWDDLFRPKNTDYIDGTSVERDYTCCGLASETDRNGIITTYEYDELRRRIRSTRAGVTTHTEYDAMGRVAFTWQTPENDFNAIIGKATNAPEYNELGELIKSYDPAGRVTEHERDVANGIVTRTTTLPGGATSIQKSYADGTRIETLGTATRHMTYGETWTTAGERVVEQAYTDNPDDYSRTVHDFLGRTIRTERPSPTGTGLAVTENHYEPGTGRLVKTVDPAGLATLYFYNDLGEQHLTVVDVNDNGEIDWSGPDRIHQIETAYVTYEGHPVRETRQYVWEAHGDPDPTLVSVSRRTHDGLQSWS